MKTSPVLRRTLAALVVIVSALTAAQPTHAKGGAVFTYAPGQCNVAGATATAVAIKTNNVRQFGMQVVGPESVGTWTINWTKNGVSNGATTDTYPPPGGWLVIGMSTAPGEKGTFRFEALATSTTGAVCSAAITVKI